MEPVSKKKHHRRLRRPVLLLILAAVLALAVGGTLLMRREQPEEIISTASHGELMDKTSEEVASLDRHPAGRGKLHPAPAHGGGIDPGR